MALGERRYDKLSELIDRVLELERERRRNFTLLAVCPNSEAVLEAAVRAASQHRAPLLLAATLNQVDRDGGYTGWTPAEFVEKSRQLVDEEGSATRVYACLDHGGPWLKDQHSRERWSFEDTFAEVKRAIAACVEAGYQLLHIDTTVDRSLATEGRLDVAVMVERTIVLIGYAEEMRKNFGKDRVLYEVGSEEVAGGLVDMRRFDEYLSLLRRGLEARNLGHAWPVFVVAQIGTDLHTTTFDPGAVAVVNDRILGLGSLIKGHYTDWVDQAQAYPITGVGAANVGPEFTAEEFLALESLEEEEVRLCADLGLERSGVTSAIVAAVEDSGRWRKWLQPGEKALAFESLSAERRRWLVMTGARYIWRTSAVVDARARLYRNLKRVHPDPHRLVVDRIAARIGDYLQHFRMTGWLDRWG